MATKKVYLKLSPRNRQKQRMAIIAASTLSMFAIIGAIFYFQFAKIENASAAVAGDFRSKASGLWSSTATWERFDGTTWLAPVAPPTNTTAGVIEIMPGHTVTVDDNFNVDQMVVDTGSTIIITNKKLAILNGAGTDLTVNGKITIIDELNINTGSAVINGQIEMMAGGKTTFNGASTFTISNGATFTNNGGSINPGNNIMFVSAGGTYIENADNGSLPKAAWNAGSTLLITGVASKLPNNLDQTFGHVTFNCNLTDHVEIKNMTIAGNFTVLNTGNYSLIETKSGGNTIINIGGNFNISGGNFSLVESGGIGTMNVSGSTNFSGGVFRMKSGDGNALLNTANLNISGGSDTIRSISDKGTATVNVTGNYSQTGGTLIMSATPGIAVVGALNVSGNFSHTGGTITQSSAGYGIITFNKNGSQTYTSGGIVTDKINFAVNSGSTLVMGTNLLGDGSIGTFTLAAGGGLSMGDPAGITSAGPVGNIRVAGTRDFNTAANYIYAATSAQITGNGLPATVNNFTLSNSSGVTLTATTSVNGILTFTSGKITTGANEMRVTNTSSTAIVGCNSSNYVIGNLRRSVLSTGSYNFPIGTAANYELATLNLSGTAGFTTVLGTFTNANPLVPNLGLKNIWIDKFTMNKMLNYGYWTLTPNNPMTPGIGSYSITLNSKGQTNGANFPNLYCVVKRSDPSQRWQSNGIHNSSTQTVAGGVVSATRSGLTSFSDFGIAYGVGFMIFENDSLISGVDGQVGATYVFPDALDDIDAWVEILSLDGGATLADIDHFTAGYDEAWQPFINAIPNSTSSILWRITFKKANTATDTTLANISLIAVDVDGDNGSLREFVETNDLTTYSYAPSCFLNMTFNNGTITATSPINNVANIDTTQVQAMFQIDKKNVRTMTYRTGAITGGSGAFQRQNSLLFKPFFANGNSPLPVSLLYFTPKVNGNKVDLNWATASEVNNNYFTVERSTDGRIFQPIIKKPGAGNSTSLHYYSDTDYQPLNGTSYYRLKQTDFNGEFTYSPLKAIVYGGSANTTEKLSIESVGVGPNPFTDQFKVNFKLTASGSADIKILDNAGHLVHKETVMVQEGINTYNFIDDKGLKPGIYIVNLSINGEVVSKKLMKK